MSEIEDCCIDCNVVLNKDNDSDITGMCDKCFEDFAREIGGGS